MTTLDATRTRVLRQPITVCTALLRHEDLVALAELLESGKMRPAIDRTYPLAEACEAVRYAMTGRARAKVVITVT
jgi:NADPH:quinone reductase-like Zn-dependent oxidoreductase